MRVPDDILEMALLSIIHRQPGHGYALGKQVAILGVHTGDLSRVYRSLQRLEGVGVLRTTWETAPGKGPARKVYSLTRRGDRYLKTGLVRLRERVVVMEKILSDGE